MPSQRAEESSTTVFACGSSTGSRRPGGRWPLLGVLLVRVHRDVSSQQLGSDVHASVDRHVHIICTRVQVVRERYTDRCIDEFGPQTCAGPGAELLFI